MRACLARGLSAAEAARAALRDDGTLPVPAISSSHGQANGAADLAASLDAFDETAAQALLDRLLADFTVESVLSQVILPYLRDLGERWASGQASIACEHFRLPGAGRGGDNSGAGRRHRSPLTGLGSSSTQPHAHGEPTAGSAHGTGHEPRGRQGKPASR
jgi:hypothetical protein